MLDQAYILFDIMEAKLEFVKTIKKKFGKKNFYQLITSILRLTKSLIFPPKYCLQPDAIVLVFHAELYS